MGHHHSPDHENDNGNGNGNVNGNVNESEIYHLGETLRSLEDWRAKRRRADWRKVWTKTGPKPLDIL